MILFVRHGESEANAKGFFAGQKDDSPLTDKGRLDAVAAAEDILSQSLKIDIIITSPLVRASETAHIIAGRINYDLAQIIVDDDLKEYDMGSLSGSLKRHIEPIDYTSSSDAEDAEAFKQRVMRAMQRAKAYDGKVLIVSHSGVARMIEADKRSVPLKEFYSVEAPPNGKVIEILN